MVASPFVQRHPAIECIEELMPAPSTAPHSPSLGLMRRARGWWGVAWFAIKCDINGKPPPP
jgi:hypothetical protein